MSKVKMIKMPSGDSIDIYDTGAVRYEETQTLNPGEKTTARTNIGAASQADLLEVEAIAKGAQKAIAYNDYESAITALNAAERTDFFVGQSVYIRKKDVPDLWISAVNPMSVVYEYTTDEAVIESLKSPGYIDTGWFSVSALETGKIDLTNYVHLDSGHTRITDDSNGDLNIYADGNIYLHGDTSVNISSRLGDVTIQNLADPVADDDAANKKYVDSKKYIVNILQQTDGVNIIWDGTIGDRFAVDFSILFEGSIFYLVKMSDYIPSSSVVGAYFEDNTSYSGEVIDSYIMDASFFFQGAPTGSYVIAPDGILGFAFPENCTVTLSGSSFYFERGFYIFRNQEGSDINYVKRLYKQGTNITYACDKSFSEMSEAYNSGKDLIARGLFFGLIPAEFRLSSFVSNEMIAFSTDLYIEGYGFTQVSIASDNSVTYSTYNPNDSYVRYDRNQTGIITDEQKAMARSNIGAAASSDIADKFFVVTFAESHFVLGADKTFDEIVAAYNNGKIVSGKYLKDGTQKEYSLAEKTDTTVSFIEISASYSAEDITAHQINITSSNEISQSEVSLGNTVKYVSQSLSPAQQAVARTNIGAVSIDDVPTKTSELDNDSDFITSFIATFSMVRGVYNCDKTFSEILTAYNDGKHITGFDSYSNINYDVVEIGSGPGGYAEFTAVTASSDPRFNVFTVHQMIVRPDETVQNNNIDIDGSIIDNAVLKVSQRMTDDEKAIARSNIDAITLSDINTHAVRFDMSQLLGPPQQLQARTNIGAEAAGNCIERVNPSEYTVGNIPVFTEGSNVSDSGFKTSDFLTTSDNEPTAPIPNEADTLHGISTGCSVGQIARITAVNSDGYPTQWEAADYPGLTVRETLDSVLIPKSAYFVGVQANLALVLPTNANNNDIITVDFESGATATSLQISGNVAGDTSYAPDPNTLVEISFKRSGNYWKMLVSSVDTPT